MAIRKDLKRLETAADPRIVKLTSIDELNTKPIQKVVEAVGPEPNDEAGEAQAITMDNNKKRMTFGPLVIRKDMQKLQSMVLPGQDKIIKLSQQ